MASCQLSVGPNNPFVVWFPMVRMDVFPGVDPVIGISSGHSIPVCKQHPVLFHTYPPLLRHPFSLEACDLFVLLAQLDSLQLSENRISFMRLPRSY